MRLAVIDDNLDFRLFLRRVAERAGWAVAEFSDGRRFLDTIGQGKPFDLILLDLLMPDLDGIEVIRLLSAAKVRVPIVLLTGGPPVNAQAARLIGNPEGLTILACCEKPVPLERLQELLASVAETDWA